MTVTSTIGSSGRNYATLALWEASIPSTLADAYVGECYNDSNSFVSASNLLTLSGHTTTSTFNIILTTGAGQSFRDNAGAQTNALEYNQANGVGIECTANYATPIFVYDDYVTIENLQILYTGTNENALHQSSNYFVVNYCIIQGSYTPLEIYNAGGGAGTYISNSLIYKTGNSSSPIASLNSTCAARFCTFVAPSDIATKPTNAITGSYGTNTIENCAVFGGATNVFGGGSSIFTATTCMTDTASPPSGFTTVTYANQFVGTTLAAPDFREKAGANLQGAATADATYGAFDIVGTARPQGTNWDIGCWELVSGGTSLTTDYYFSLVSTGVQARDQNLSISSALGLASNATLQLETKTFLSNDAHTPNSTRSGLVSDEFLPANTKLILAGDNRVPIAAKLVLYSNETIPLLVKLGLTSDSRIPVITKLVLHSDSDLSLSARAGLTSSESLPISANGALIATIDALFPLLTQLNLQNDNKLQAASKLDLVLDSKLPGLTKLSLALDESLPLSTKVVMFVIGDNGLPIITRAVLDSSESLPNLSRLLLTLDSVFPNSSKLNLIADENTPLSTQTVLFVISDGSFPFLVRTILDSDEQFPLHFITIVSVRISGSYVVSDAMKASGITSDLMTAAGVIGDRMV